MDILAAISRFINRRESWRCHACHVLCVGDGATFLGVKYCAELCIPAVARDAVQLRAWERSVAEQEAILRLGSGA